MLICSYVMINDTGAKSINKTQTEENNLRIKIKKAPEALCIRGFEAALSFQPESAHEISEAVCYMLKAGGAFRQMVRCGFHLV